MKRPTPRPPVRFSRAPRRPGSINVNRPAPENRSLADGSLVGRPIYYHGAPGPDASGSFINERTALGLVAVYAAIRNISDDISVLPLRLRQRLPDGSCRTVTDRPVARLFTRSPDGGQTTPVNFVRTILAHALGWGTGAAEIVRDGSGEPVSLHLIDPAQTRPVRSQDGGLYYHAGGVVLSQADVLVVSGMGYDGITGYNPIRLAKQALGTASASDTFAASFFGNGSAVGGFLTTPKRLSPEAKANLRSSFEAIHQGAGSAHRIGILEEGLEFKPSPSIDPESAQLLATREFSVIEIARLFRISPTKLGDLQHASFSTLEAVQLSHITDCLTPWASQIEHACNLRLLSESDHDAGLHFEFDFSALRRGDSQARAGYWQTMSNLGVVNANTIAIAEGFEPHAGGDRFLVPLNMADATAQTSPAPVPSESEEVPANG